MWESFCSSPISLYFPQQGQISQNSINLNSLVPRLPSCLSCIHPRVLGGRRVSNYVCVCVCTYTSAKEGMAPVKWRVSARTCQKGPQSSASRGGKCMRVCIRSITGSRKCPLKGPIANSACKLGIEPLVESGYAVTHPWHSAGGCLCVPCGFFLGWRGSWWAVTGVGGWKARAATWKISQLVVWIWLKAIYEWHGEDFLDWGGGGWNLIHCGKGHGGATYCTRTYKLQPTISVVLLTLLVFLIPFYKLKFHYAIVCLWHLSPSFCNCVFYYCFPPFPCKWFTWGTAHKQQQQCYMKCCLPTRPHSATKNLQYRGNNILTRHIFSALTAW